MNHILNFSVQQIADVCVPVLFYVYGTWDYCTATKTAIDHELKEKTLLDNK